MEHWWNDDWQRKMKYMKKAHLTVTLSTSNATWTSLDLTPASVVRSQQHLPELWHGLKSIQLKSWYKIFLLQIVIYVISFSVLVGLFSISFLQCPPAPEVNNTHRWLKQENKFMLLSQNAKCVMQLIIFLLNASHKNGFAEKTSGCRHRLTTDFRHLRWYKHCWRQT